MNYQKIYNQLIQKAKSENRQKNNEIYYEAHHIIPKCLGGKGDSRNIRHENIVLLTAKEHFIAHLLLCEIYHKNIPLQNALWILANAGKYKVNSKQFEKLRLQKKKNLTGDNNPMKRLEVRKKFMGDLNVWRKPENRGRWAGENNPMYGKKRPDNILRNIENSKKVIRTNIITGEIKEYSCVKNIILDEEHKHLKIATYYAYCMSNKLMNKKYIFKYK